MSKKQYITNSIENDIEFEDKQKTKEYLNLDEYDLKNASHMNRRAGLGYIEK